MKKDQRVHSIQNLPASRRYWGNQYSDDNSPSVQSKKAPKSVKLGYANTREKMESMDPMFRRSKQDWPLPPPNYNNIQTTTSNY
jgi:hypothetical protein